MSNQNNILSIDPAHSPTRAKLPIRGTVLCIHEDPAGFRDLESRLVDRNFGLLRAPQGMAGYWMAVSGAPDVIVVDLSTPGQDVDYLLQSLMQNPKTVGIPVIGLIKPSEQTTAGPLSGLRHLTHCLSWNTDVPDLVETVEKLVENQPQPAYENNSSHDRVDAYFSELGHRGTRGPRIRGAGEHKTAGAEPIAKPADRSFAVRSLEDRLERVVFGGNMNKKAAEPLVPGSAADER